MLVGQIGPDDAVRIADAYRLVAVGGLDGVAKGRPLLERFGEPEYRESNGCYEVRYRDGSVGVRKSDGRIKSIRLFDGSEMRDLGYVPTFDKAHVQELVDYFVSALGFPHMGAKIMVIRNSFGPEGPVQVAFWPTWRGIRYSRMISGIATLDDKTDRLKSLLIETCIRPPENTTNNLNIEQARGVMISHVFNTLKLQSIEETMAPEPVVALSRDVQPGAHDRDWELATAWEDSYRSEFAWEGSYADPSTWNDKTKGYLKFYMPQVGAIDGKLIRAEEFPPAGATMGGRTEVTVKTPNFSAMNQSIGVYSGKYAALKKGSLTVSKVEVELSNPRALLVRIGSHIWKCLYSRKKRIVQASVGEKVVQAVPSKSLVPILDACPTMK